VRTWYPCAVSAARSTRVICASSSITKIRSCIVLLPVPLADILGNFVFSFVLDEQYSIRRVAFQELTEYQEGKTCQFISL